MVNVTNYNPTWASELSTPSVLQALCGLFGICREGFNHHRSTQNSDPRLDPLSIVNQPHHTSLPSLDHRVNDVVFDLLCVDLGLLANLVEQSTEATDMLRETREFFYLLSFGLVQLSQKDNLAYSILVFVL
jgi:hypothetical protein